MLDYQCVTEKAVASSRKADTRNFVCGRGSSHLRQSLAEHNDFISPFILLFISPFISQTLSICYISWQAIKSPDSLQLSIIMTCTLTKIIGFVRKTGQFHGQVYVELQFVREKTF